MLQLRATRSVSSCVAMEHTCHVCGWALGRVRAPLDPIYKLPVVVCPGCATACVRRRHPLSVWWRSQKRLRRTAGGLLWRAIVAVLMAACTIGLASMVSQTWRGMSFWELVRDVRGGGPTSETVDAWREEYGPGIAGVGAAWCVAVGATLAAGLGHVRRRWMVWGAMGAAVAGWLLLDGFMSFVNQESRMWPSHENHGPQIWTYFDVFGRLGSWMVPGLAIALLGVPLGQSLRGMMAKRERMRWIKKLARARKRRLAL